MPLLQPMRVTYKLRGVGVQRCAGSWHIARRRHGRVVLGIRGHAHAKYGLMSSKYRWRIGWKASLQDTLQSGAIMRELSGAIDRRGIQTFGETCTWHHPSRCECTQDKLHISYAGFAQRLLQAESAQVGVPCLSNKQVQSAGR